jgi:hypothetical protein
MSKKGLPVPRWLFIQRTGLYLYFITGMFLLIYTLGFVTNIYLFYAYGDQELNYFYQDAQDINRDFLIKSIGIIIFAAVFFFLELKNHAAGFVSLILGSVLSVLGVIFSIYNMLDLFFIRGSYLDLDLSSLNRFIERGTISYSFSTLTFDLGIALNGLFIGVSLFFAMSILINALTVKDGVS